MNYFRSSREVLDATSAPPNVVSALPHATTVRPRASRTLSHLASDVFSLSMYVEGYLRLSIMFCPSFDPLVLLDVDVCVGLSVSARSSVGLSRSDMWFVLLLAFPWDAAACVAMLSTHVLETTIAPLRGFMSYHCSSCLNSVLRHINDVPQLSAASFHIGCLGVRATRIRHDCFANGTHILGTSDIESLLIRCHTVAANRTSWSASLCSISARS